MELKDAIDGANEILNEEQKSPTVSYADSFEGGPGFLGVMASLAGPMYLNSLRLQRPRTVQDDPHRYVFKSKNYTLLIALLSQVPEPMRLTFVQGIMVRLVSQPACSRAQYAGFPSWNKLVSELPLVAEFAIRNGASKRFFRLLAEASPSPGHVILVRHLEDMIALNFTILTKADYLENSLLLDNFSRTTKLELAKWEKQRAGDVRFPGVGVINITSAFREIIAAVEGIKEECRKASYLYVKASLSEGLNVEVNQDKNAVESYLSELGFRKILIDSLNEAERLYYGPATAFDLKASMSHLRSFIETLHADSVLAIVAKGAVGPANGWGPNLIFLRQTAVLTPKEEAFVAGLYGLISDQAVHPLVAEREYARLARNMIIEYALLFLVKLKKLNLTGPRS
jgi:hypothetical protein